MSLAVKRSLQQKAPLKRVLSYFQIFKKTNEVILLIVGTIIGKGLLYNVNYHLRKIPRRTVKNRYLSALTVFRYAN